MQGAGRKRADFWPPLPNLPTSRWWLPTPIAHPRFEDRLWSDPTTAVHCLSSGGQRRFADLEVITGGGIVLVRGYSCGECPGGVQVGHI